jgi:hypothetical protein
VRARAVIEHVVCDNPVCAQAHPDPLVGHIWPSTQRENLLRMRAEGRRGHRWWHRRWSGLSRAERAERSRQLADAVRDGWTTPPCAPCCCGSTRPDHAVLTVKREFAAKHLPLVELRVG